MNRLSSAKIQAGQRMNDRAPDRFNEQLEAPSLKSGRGATLSQANLHPLRNKSSVAGDGKSLANRSRASRHSRITINSAYSRPSVAPEQVIQAHPYEDLPQEELVEDNRTKIINLVQQLDDNELAKVSELLTQ